MKNFKKSLAAIMLIVTAATFLISCKGGSSSRADFKRGLNLSKWFETWNYSIPNLKVYDKSDFIHIKELGSDVIRVPIHFASFVNNKNEIEPIIFEYLDKACDWAEELEMYIVIDNHSFNSGAYPAPAKVEESLLLLWPQIAARYKNRSKYIVYEILNEPQFNNQAWEPIQKKALEAIRKVDKKHTVVVTGADWSGLNSMCNLQPLADKNIIYTFHFYEPFIFTHQGANWGDSGLAVLADIPFPYNKDKMPEIPADAKTASTRAQLANYPKTGNEATLRKRLEQAAAFSEKVHAPVWCGEMGVHDFSAPNEDRNNWYKSVGAILSELKIPFCVWGYDDSFGIFEPGSRKRYPADLNASVLTALGMTVPEGVGLAAPASSDLPLVLYDDFYGKGVDVSSWSTQLLITNHKEDPTEGDFCIMTGLMERYAGIAWDLTKKNLSDIEGNQSNVYLCFDVKFTSDKQAFQIRFVDTDDGTTANIPWRLAYDVRASDGKVKEWNKVEIPISSMNCWGAWSNITESWTDIGSNKFDWSRVWRLELAAEEWSISGKFFLDNMRIEVR
ncbi:MAG: glycoside hydrolase family 5 protein [Treponema sp.]|nr:glycoside hydrolase family 5 protein [Treponema sp.]